jgi:hypothetical protein
MAARSLLSSLGVLVVFLSACPSNQVPEVPSVLDAGADAGGAPVDAGPPALTFRLAVSFVDGGHLDVDLGDAGVLALESANSLELTSPIPLLGARVRLLDWTDAVVAGDDELEVSDAGFRYRIQPLQPLKSGRGYSVLVDAESTDQFTDAYGRSHDELRVPLRIAGEVQPEPGQTTSKKKRKKR